jgi:hypothetical protein
MESGGPPHMSTSPTFGITHPKCRTSREQQNTEEPTDALGWNFLCGGSFDASAFGGCDVPS